MKNATNIMNELTIEWMHNGFDTATITVGKGYRVSVTPCDITSYQELKDHQKRLETDPNPYFGYFLVSSAELPWLGGSDLRKICENLANYDKLIAENQSEENKLRAFRDKMLAQTSFEDFMEMFDSYSDWHKDIYGHRPHADAELNAKYNILKNRAVA